MPDNARFDAGDRVVHMPSGMAATVLASDHGFVLAMIRRGNGDEMVYVELDVQEAEKNGPIGRSWDPIPEISDLHRFRILDPREVRRVRGPDSRARPQPPLSWTDDD